MPFTYFAHQVFVLPFKVARPRWFDGTALCIGSMAPDFAYAFEALPFEFGSHTASSQFTWTLPFTLLATLCVRRLATPLGEQLPSPLGLEVQALSRSRHSPLVSAWSALLGGFSHVFVDGFTHGHGWAVAEFPSLRAEVFDAIPVSKVLQYTGHTLGTLIGFAMFARLVAARRVSQWNGDADSAEAREPERWFWPFVAAGSLLSIPAASSVLVTGGGAPAAIMRASWVLLAVLVVATLRARRPPATC
ncbi:MAG TPA: DUF4184 family protein [Polyangiales bacterium]|nr:DUF4184 family protein [Polyangiales bacterium]